jgi:acetylglutamate kinase
MKYIVKLGGATLEDPALLRSCAHAIAELVRARNEVAVVHGGGVQLTRVLKQLGKQSEFIGGLRITDAETRDTALMVLGGGVNKALVAALAAQAVPAVGMSGGDGMVFRARKKRTAPDLGFVGEIAAADPRWLQAIWAMGGVPVLSSIALGFDGEYYNINADEMAAACAGACHADALVFLTDVPGVRGADGAVMRWLNTEQIGTLTRDAVITRRHAAEAERLPRSAATRRQASENSACGSCFPAARALFDARSGRNRGSGCLIPLPARCARKQIDSVFFL